MIGNMTKEQFKRTELEFELGHETVNKGKVRTMAKNHVYDTLDVLSVAFATHRHNGGYYRDTRRFSEDTPTLFSNKDSLTYQVSSFETPPPDFQPITVTDEDRDNARKSVDFLHKDNALGIIAGSLNDFMTTLLDTISRSTLKKADFGVVAVLPKVYFDSFEKKTLKKKLKGDFNESRHIGRKGELVVGMFTLNEIKFVERFGCHVLNGSIEGNLVSFFKSFDQTKDLPIVNTTYKLKGKVKGHGENFITKLPETMLNYVKIGWHLGYKTI